MRADQAQSATLSALRYRVALAKGLPANLAERLQGTTQEELEADADELAGMVTTTPNGAVRPDPSQGPRSSQQSAGPASDFAAAVSKALSR
jgi:hypothetical protein